jgi:hypothetical protein
MITEIKFPKQYKPLPKGYKVIWSEESEHYFGVDRDGEESVMFCSRFAARKWCFNHDHQELVKWLNTLDMRFEDLSIWGGRKL